MIKDILIIGCGPTGLYAWKIANDLNLSGDIIEAKETYGGQVTSLYPEKYIYNFPSIGKIKGKDAMKEMFNIVNDDNDNIKVFFNTTILDIIQIDNNKKENEKFFKVTLSNNKIMNYRKILICEGLNLSKPKKLVDLNYSNIYYSIKNINDFENQKIIVFGGGDSALDWANNFSLIAKEIILIHRRNEFRANPLSVEIAKNNKVNFLTPYKFLQVSDVDNEIAKKIKIQNLENNKIIELDFDSIVVQFGREQTNDNFKNLNIKKDNLNKFIVDKTMQTSFDGIYAAGDCCVYESKIRNLISSFYEAMQAVMNINKVIKNKNSLGIGW